MSWDIEVTKNVIPGWWGVQAKCSECGATFHFARAIINYPTEKLMEDAAPSIGGLQDHADQHKPGRALDIYVEYELVAQCSVCEDGGNVRIEDGELLCDQCGTTWSTDGTMGERNE